MAIIRHGNARVLRARFNDARFFWDYDQKIPLSDRVEMLKNVTFQKDLGSYFRQDSEQCADGRGACGAVTARRIPRPAALAAVLLAKTDLTAELVKEFTELQGIIGGLYARAQGLGEKVAQAIYAQYLPGIGWKIAYPQRLKGRSGLADRMQQLWRCLRSAWSPADRKIRSLLRRAANGNRQNSRRVGSAAHACRYRSDCARRSAFREPVGEAVPQRASRILSARSARLLLRRGERGARDRAHNGAAMRSRVHRRSPRSAARTICWPSRLRSSGSRTSFARPTRSTETAIAERRPHRGGGAALYAEVKRMLPRWRRFAPAAICAGSGADRDSAPCGRQLFRPVMVMAPEPHLRRNRLALIAAVLKDFSRIADFSEIVTSNTSG